MNKINISFFISGCMNSSNSKEFAEIKITLEKQARNNQTNSN